LNGFKFRSEEFAAFQEDVITKHEQQQPQQQQLNWHNQYEVNTEQKMVDKG
jgi:hypothetical protein